VAYSRNKLALRIRLRSLNLKSQFSIFDSFRDIHVHIYDFLKFVGGLWALGWAWHSTETNLCCVRSSGICTPNLNSLAPIVSEISAIIRTDRRTDGRTDMARSTRLVILIKNIYTLWGRNDHINNIHSCPSFRVNAEISRTKRARVLRLGM